MRRSLEGFNQSLTPEYLMKSNFLPHHSYSHTYNTPGPRVSLLADAHNGHVDDTAV